MVLLLLNGFEEGRYLDLAGDRQQIGRTSTGSDTRPRPTRNTAATPPNDIVLAYDQRVSGVHAVFVREGDQWSVEDAGSTLGTFINWDETKISCRTPLHAGDVVRIGATLLLVLQNRDDPPVMRPAMEASRTN